MVKRAKYLLNTLTGTLHIVGMCCHSKSISASCKTYATEDDAVKNNQRYMKNCKICFKERD